MSQENEEVIDQTQSQENDNVVDQGAAPQETSVEQQVPQSVDEVSADEKASQIDYIMSMAEQDPSIKDLPEYQDMLKEMEAIDKSKTQANEEQDDNVNEDDKDDLNKGDKDKTLEEDESEEAEESEEDDFEDLSDEDDVFGLKKSGKKKTKYKFENEKDVVKLIQKKGFKEVPTFFESVDKWRSDSQELVSVQERAQNLEDGLSSLPTPIKDAIVAYSNSQDWRSAFSNSAESLDFNTDFESLNKEAVVKYYFKDKYEKIKTKFDEDYYDEEEYNDRINDFYESSERLFDRDKTSIEKKRAEIIDQQNREAEAFKESALSSVKSLKDKFPNFKSSQLQKIRQILVNGDANTKMFVDDGKYVDDAAEMVAYALYGKQMFKARIAKAKTEGKNESKEDFFLRGDKKPKTKNSQQGYSGKRAEGSVAHLEGQFKKSTYS